MILLTRDSNLAIVQTEMIAAPLRALGHDVAIRRVVTRGDRDKYSPPSPSAAQGLSMHRGDTATRGRANPKGPSV